jgi:cysteine desulfurase
MDGIIYLDHAATTPVRPEVRREMMIYMSDYFGNASSLYTLGQMSKKAIDPAREKVARLIGASPEEVYFTSGGSESDNWAIKGTFFAKQDKGRHLITSAIEHHAVLDTCEQLQKMGGGLTVLPVDSNGMVDPDDVKNAIRPDTILISVMHANNEIGTIQPIAEIGKIAKEAGVTFHVDAVQTVGHYPVDVDAMNCDLLSLSGHKLYGPKGVGAMYMRKGTRVLSLIHGGGQERKRRAGTENVPGIVGLGKAAELAMAELEKAIERESALRNDLLKKLETAIPDSHLNGHPTQRLSNNLNISFAGVEGEAILLRLDREGICASTGSACTTGSLEPSHVLMAIGLKHEQTHGSVRFTFGRSNVAAHVDFVAKVMEKTVSRLREMSPTYVPGEF